jgi:hypothetical protein
MTKNSLSGVKKTVYLRTFLYYVISLFSSLRSLYQAVKICNTSNLVTEASDSEGKNWVMIAFSRQFNVKCCFCDIRLLSWNS